MLTKKQKHFKTKWLAALRSDEYVQIKGRLADIENGRCCLGVACDIAINDGMQIKSEIEDISRYYITGKSWTISNDALIPHEVIKAYKIPIETSGQFNDSYIEFNGQCISIPSLAILNDGNTSLPLEQQGSLTFKQIADVIDYLWT